MLKKLRILPSVLMLIMCIGVLAVGVYASMGSVNNKIEGEIIINASNHAVDIEFLVDGKSIETFEDVRAGVPINMGKLAFNTEYANEAIDVDDLEVTIKITNKSNKELGAYYCLTSKESEAVGSDILTKDPINGTGTLASTTVATAYFQAYSYIAPSTDANGYDTIEMPIVFRCNSLESSEITSEKFTYYLNIEEYETDVKDTDVVQGNSLAGFVKLPSTLTSIPDSAFEENEDITNLVIPSSVTACEVDAFCFMRGLKSVSIPESVTSIGEFAFYENINLETLFLPDNITILPASSVRFCYKIEYVKLPKGLTELGNSALAEAKLLTKIDIPTSLNATGKLVFGGSGLVKVELPDSLTNMGIALFQNCKSLKYAKLPSTLIDIPTHTFNNCENLVEVDYAENIKKIGTQAFNNCSNLHSFSLKSNVKELIIGQQALCGTGLSGELFLPDNVTLEGNSNGQFVNTNITAFKVSETNTKYMTIDGVLYKKENNKPVKLEAYPSASCLEEFTLPASATILRRYELNCAKNLKYINVETGNSKYFSRNGILYNKATDTDGTTKYGMLIVPLKYEINGEVITHITVDDDVAILGGEFSANLDYTSSIEGTGLIGDNIKSITIPSTVKAIAGCAFQNATNLETINSTTVGTFDLSNVNLAYIGYKSFEFCDKLTKLYIGKYTDASGNEQQLSIGYGFVYNATNLKEIHVSATKPPKLIENASVPVANHFINLSGLNIYVPNAVVDNYKSSWTNFTSIIIGE